MIMRAGRVRNWYGRLLIALYERRNALSLNACGEMKGGHIFRSRGGHKGLAPHLPTICSIKPPRPLAGTARAALLALCLAGGLVFSDNGLTSIAHARSVAPPAKPYQIEVSARPITAFRPGDDTRTFGELTFLGGLILTSSDPVFGGISGFHLSQQDNSFLAVTDKGTLLSGRLDVDGEQPVGLSNVMAAALKDEKGRPLARRGRGDAESITLAPDAVYIGLERINEIWRYPRPPMGRNGTQVKVPKGVRELRNNLGLESLVHVPSGPLKGALIGIGEAGLKEGGDLPGFIIGGPMPGTFTIAKSSFFNATDAALGPDGELFLLERHFSWFTGVLMQLRRFRLDDIRPGAALSGEVLGTFNNTYEIDNMEGMSVTVGADGRTLLTLISDDNFSPIQRTILLRFALPPR